jgi:hypothetical protein
MLTTLSYRRKNIMLIIAGVLTLIGSYNLAFKKTLTVIELNRELKAASNPGNEALAYTPEYLKRKEIALKSVLKLYQVEADSWQDNFWTVGSQLAAAKNVNVIFNPEVASQTDSLNKNPLVLNQTIQFDGHFPDLVRLTDTLEKSSSIGRITSLTISKKKINSVEKVVMRVDFKGVGE